MPDNYIVIELFNYLHGQVIIHPLETKKKDEHKSLTVLNFQAIQFLFDVFDVSNRQAVFQKLFMLNDFLRNTDEIQVAQDEQRRKRQFMKKMAGLAALQKGSST